MTLGQRIQSARKWRGWSLKKLAEIASVDASTNGAIEADENDPGAQKLRRIANALGMTVSQALGEMPDQLTKQERAVLAALRNHQGN